MAEQNGEDGSDSPIRPPMRYKATCMKNRNNANINNLRLLNFSRITPVIVMSLDVSCLVS